MSLGAGSFGILLHCLNGSGQLAQSLRARIISSPVRLNYFLTEQPCRWELRSGFF